MAAMSMVRGKVLLSLFLLSMAIPCFAQTARYELIVLSPVDPTMSFPESYFWDINDDGLVCGTVTRSGTYAGYVSDFDGVELLYEASWLRGINNAGQVAGHNLVLDTATGTQTVIAPVSDTYNVMWAQAVNDNGIVVGVAAYYITQHDNQVAFVWDEVNGTRPLAVPGAKELLRINNSNKAVGNIRPSSGSSQAFIYDVDTGDWIDLHSLLNPTPPGYSIAADISDRGVVAGEGWNGSQYRAFTWESDRGFTFLPNLGGGDLDRVHPTGINMAGAVVGYALTAQDGWRGFIWDPFNGMQDLNDLIDDTGGFVIRRAIRINERGMIVGDGQWGPTGTAHAFLLMPASGSVGVEPRPTIELSIQARPNPFRGSVALDVRLPGEGSVRLGIYDLAGRRIAAVMDGDFQAGRHTRFWTGRREGGEPAPTGVYFAILEADGKRLSRKIILTR